MYSRPEADRDEAFDSTALRCGWNMPSSQSDLMLDGIRLKAKARLECPYNALAEPHSHTVSLCIYR